MQNAIQDQNRFPAFIAHSGTAGTAETIRVTASASGALNVDFGTAPIGISVGTIAEITNIAGGTITTTLDTTGLATDTNQAIQIQQITDVTEVNVHTNSSELRTYQENHVCLQNTTSTPLAAGSTFTGDWQDCLNYQEVNVSIVADKNSATNGLVFQWSADGTAVGDTDTYSYYTANGGTNYTPNPSFRYVRMAYTNGAEAQGSFSLQTILRRGMTGGSFHRINTSLKDDADGRLQISVPKLRTGVNTYVSQTATTAGNAKVSLEEFESSVGGLWGFVKASYDYIALTYVAAGNGVGEIETVTFKTGGAGGTTVATLTLAYNASNEISSVTKS